MSVVADGAHDEDERRAHVELRQLRYFVAAAEYGSLTAAANAMHISQPPLSLAIANLEKELEVVLFVRSSRGVRLTNAGTQLLDYAKRMLEDTDAIRSRLSRHLAGTIGRVSLALVPTLMWSLPTVLAKYVDDYPDVDIRLVDAWPLEVLDLVTHRAVDFGLLASADNRRLAEQYSPHLHVTPWGNLPLVMILPADESLPDLLDLSVLEGKPLITPRRNFTVPSLTEIVDEALMTNAVTPRVQITVDSIPMSLPLVAAGLGSAIVPDVGPLAFSDPRITVRRIVQSVPPLEVSIVWHRNGPDSTAAAKFQQLIRSKALGTTKTGEAVKG